MEDDDELRKPFLFVGTAAAEEDVDLSTCQSWNQMIEEYAKSLRDTDSSQAYFNADERITAEQRLLQRLQQETFGEKVEALSPGKFVHKESRLLQLAPFIDEDGILRVGGRLRNTPDDVPSQPIILDGRHRYMRLIAVENAC